MSMFCFQCQETAGGKGCTVRGVCGKVEEVANLQDLLVYALRGIAYIVTNGKTRAHRQQIAPCFRLRSFTKPAAMSPMA